MMKRMIQLSLLSVALLVQGWAPPAEAAAAEQNCGGCENLKTAEAKLAVVSLADESKIGVLLNSASKAILAMPQEKGKRLSQPQIRQMVALLVQVVKVDNLHIVLQDVVSLIKANKAEFDREVARVGGENGRKLANYTVIVLDEETGGNDESPVELKKAK